MTDAQERLLIAIANNALGFSVEGSNELSSALHAARDEREQRWRRAEGKAEGETQYHWKEAPFRVRVEP